jgi:hypothetical protein
VCRYSAAAVNGFLLDEGGAKEARRLIAEVGLDMYTLLVRLVSRTWTCQACISRLLLTLRHVILQSKHHSVDDSQYGLCNNQSVQPGVTTLRGGETGARAEERRRHPADGGGAVQAQAASAETQHRRLGSLRMYMNMSDDDFILWGDGMGEFRCDVAYLLLLKRESESERSAICGR